jgi:hypothetical protein
MRARYSTLTVRPTVAITQEINNRFTGYDQVWAERGMEGVGNGKLESLLANTRESVGSHRKSYPSPYGGSCQRSRNYKLPLVAISIYDQLEWVP